MNPSLPESLDKTITNEPLASEPWTTPQLDKLPVEETAVAAPGDVADAGIFS